MTKVYFCLKRLMKKIIEEQNKNKKMSNDLHRREIQIYQQQTKVRDRILPFYTNLK